MKGVSNAEADRSLATAQGNLQSLVDSLVSPSENDAHEVDPEPPRCDSAEFISAASKAVAAWAAIHALMSTVDELLTMVGDKVGFPKDSWQAGRRVHVDRSAVYAIQVVNMS